MAGRRAKRLWRVGSDTPAQAQEMQVRLSRNRRDRLTRPHPVSACCQAAVAVVGADEGTLHYLCMACNKACDPLTLTSEGDAEIVREGVSREIPLHNKIIKHCNAQFPRWLYIHANPSAPSTIQEGAPDFPIIYLPNGKYVTCEIKTATGKLSDKQRETLELFFFEGLKLGEIAERSGEDLTNIRHHYYRGLERLRQVAHKMTRNGKSER